MKNTLVLALKIEIYLPKENKMSINDNFLTLVLVWTA